MSFLKSRTFWLIVALVAFNTITAVKALVPASYQSLVDIVLGLLATYTHVNPTQNYSGEITDLS